MKNKNNIISISLVVLWLVLGAVLMIRVPMEQVVDEAVRKLYLADTVLSGAFIAISLISAPLGYCTRFAFCSLLYSFYYHIKRCDAWIRDHAFESFLCAFCNERKICNTRYCSFDYYSIYFPDRVLSAFKDNTFRQK